MKGALKASSIGGCSLLSLLPGLPPHEPPLLMAATIIDPVALPLLYYRDFSLCFFCEVCFHSNRKRN